MAARTRRPRARSPWLPFPTPCACRGGRERHAAVPPYARPRGPYAVAGCARSRGTSCIRRSAGPTHAHPRCIYRPPPLPHAPPSPCAQDRPEPSPASAVRRSPAGSSRRSVPPTSSLASTQANLLAPSLPRTASSPEQQPPRPLLPGRRQGRPPELLHPRPTPQIEA
jgi:hypothetical protein